MTSNHYNVELNQVESFSFLFKYVWSSFAANKLRVNILDTILFQNGSPFMWLFTSELTGEVLKKKAERLSSHEIVRAFKQKAHNIYSSKHAKLKTKLAIVWYIQSDTKLSSYLVDEKELTAILSSKLSEIVAIQAFMGSYALKGNGLFEHTFRIVDKRILHSTYENVDNSAYDNPNTFFTNNLNVSDHTKKLYIREQQHDIICLSCNRLVTYLIANVHANIKSLTVQVVFDTNWNPFIVSAQQISLSHASEAFVSLRDAMIYAYGSKPVLPSFDQKSLLLPMHWSEHNASHAPPTTAGITTTGTANSRPASAPAVRSTPRKTQSTPVAAADPVSLEEFSFSSAVGAVEHLQEGRSHSPFKEASVSSPKSGSPFPMLKKQLSRRDESLAGAENSDVIPQTELSEADDILLNTAIRTWSVAIESTGGSAGEINESSLVKPPQRSASAALPSSATRTNSSDGGSGSPNGAKFQRSQSAAAVGTPKAAISSANLSKSAIVNTKALFQLPSGTVNISHNDIVTAKEIHKTSSADRIDAVKSNFVVNHNTRKANVAATVETSLAEKAAMSGGATNKATRSGSAAAAAVEPDAGEGRYMADVEYMYARFNDNKQHNSDLMINEFAKILEPPPKEKFVSTKVRKSQSNKELGSSRPQSAPAARKTASVAELAKLREGQKGILYQNTGLNHFSTHNSDNHLLSNYHNKERLEKQRIKKEKTEEFDRLSSTFNSAALDGTADLENSNLVDEGEVGVDEMYHLGDTYHSHMSQKLTQSSVLRNHDDVITSMTRRHINSNSQNNLTTIDRERSSLLNVTESVHMRTTFYASQIKDQTNMKAQQEKVFNRRRPISAPHTKDHANPIDRHQHRPFAATSDDYHNTVNCLVKVLPLSGAHCFGDYCQFIHNRSLEEIQQERLFEALEQQNNDPDNLQPFEYLDPRHNFTNSLQKPPKVRSKDCPHQISYKSILLARAEEAFVETSLESDMQSLWDQLRLSNLTNEQMIGFFVVKHLKRVMGKCTSQARVLSYNSSVAPINAWNDLGSAYRQLVYTDALTKIHPSRFYYTVPMCEVCFKIYTYLDAQRELTVLQPYANILASNTAPVVNRLPGYHKMMMTRAKDMDRSTSVDDGQLEANDEMNVTFAGMAGNTGMTEGRAKSPPLSPTTRRSSPPVDDVKDLAAPLRPKKVDTVFPKHDHHSVAARRSHSASKLRLSHSSNPLTVSQESVTPLNRTNSQQFDKLIDRGIGSKGPMHKNVLSVGITTRGGQVSSWVKLYKPEKVRPKKQYMLNEDERLTQEVGITTSTSGKSKSKSAAKLRTAVSQANEVIENNYKGATEAGAVESDPVNEENDEEAPVESAQETEKHVENAYNANEIMYYASNMPPVYPPVINPYANQNFTAMESYYYQQQMQQIQMMQQQNNAMLAMMSAYQHQPGQQSADGNNNNGIDYSVFAVNPYVSSMTPFPVNGSFVPGYVPIHDPSSSFTPFSTGPYYPLTVQPPEIGSNPQTLEAIHEH